MFEYKNVEIGEKQGHTVACWTFSPVYLGLHYKCLGLWPLT